MGLVFALPIFPGSHPPSIVGVHVLNFCVRDGNRWAHMTINTNFMKSSNLSVGALCSRYLSSRVGQVLSCRPQVSSGHLQAEKSPGLSTEALCWHYLSSRAVARQVLSAQMSLTSVFGMGTGGPSLQSIRTILLKESGDPYRIRTDVNGVRGRCLNHLTNGPLVHLQGLEPGTH